MSEFIYLKPEQVKVGKRFREDYGDLQELADDITVRGMLQPIIVNEDYELCDGGRRFAAFQLAREQTNWEDTEDPWNRYATLEALPCHVVPTAEELDIREIELVANVLRKDLSWSEAVKLQKRIHELMLEKHPDDWSLRQSAKMLNKSPGALSENVQLAKVIEQFPTLANEPTADSARKKFKRVLEQAEVTQELSKAKRQVALQERMVSDAAEAGVSGPSEISTTNYWLTVLDKAYRVEDAIAGMLSAHEGSAHFAEVDPPYGVDLQKEKSDAAAGLKHYNEVPKDEYERFLQQTCDALYYVLADDTFCIFWHAPTWGREAYNALTHSGFKVDDIPAIWNKVDTGVAANNPDVYLGRGYEPFFVARKGSPILRRRGRKNVFDFKPVPAPQKFHPTERPISLIREIIGTFLYPGARVIIPFLGSGNSIIAAYQEGAKLVWGFDLSEQYRDSFLVKAKAELMHKTQQEYEMEALERIGDVI